MNSLDLLLACGAAFVWVFVILILLAAVMRLVGLLFPERPTGPDAAVIAAVGAVAHTVFPGTRITHIEEKS